MTTTNEETETKFFSTRDAHGTMKGLLFTEEQTSEVEAAIARIIGPMGAPSVGPIGGVWPGRRPRAVGRALPTGYSREITITDESIDAAFSPWIPPPAVTPAMLATSLAFVAAPYAAVTYAPMTRAALLDGCDDAEECPPTIRSFK